MRLRRSCGQRDLEAIDATRCSKSAGLAGRFQWTSEWHYGWKPIPLGRSTSSPIRFDSRSTPVMISRSSENGSTPPNRPCLRRTRSGNHDDHDGRPRCSHASLICASHHAVATSWLARSARSQDEVTTVTIASDAMSITHAYRTVPAAGLWVQSSRTCPALRSNGATATPLTSCGQTARHQAAGSPASQIEATVVIAGAMNSQTCRSGPSRPTKSSSAHDRTVAAWRVGTCELPAGRRRLEDRTRSA